jgi:diguanylate cyclase (GGDEF)-like protein
MSFDQLVILIIATQGKNLTPAQKMVLEAAWNGETYASIANQSIYESNYLKTTAARLWQIISQVLKIPITKATLRSVVEGYALTNSQEKLITAFTHYQSQKLRARNKNYPDSPIANQSNLIPSTSNSADWLEYPSGPVPLNSLFYIERGPETIAYKEIIKPGSILRIHSPRQMGKSSLLLRILNQASQLGYEQITVDMSQADRAIVSDLNRFLRWLCSLVSQQLNIPVKVDQYWQDEIGSKISCTLYFKNYLLAQCNRPIVLAINELNRLFKNSQTTEDFLSLLQSWMEASQSSDNFQKLRLVLLYSTDFFPDEHLSISAFNIGVPLSLKDLTVEEVEELADRYHLTWHRSDSEKLMAMVGGHPALVRLAFYHLVRQRHVGSDNISLDQLLEFAPSEFGIYRDHLHELMLILEKNQSLHEAFQKVLKSPTGIDLGPRLADRLHSLGLVNINHSLKVTIRCNLYQLYFSRLLLSDFNLCCGDRDPKSSSENAWEIRFQELTDNYQQLQDLCYQDFLTNLVNQLGFAQYIEMNWSKLLQQEIEISLIIADLDFLNIYTDRYGEAAAKLCLQKISEVMIHIVNNQSDRADNVIARVDREKFVILLPGSSADRAFNLAERIREQVKNLGFTHDHSWMGGLPDVLTMSLGVASLKADPESDVDWLIKSANIALEEAKKQGRDRTSVYRAF